MRRERWKAREKRNAMREAIAEARSIRAGSRKRQLTDAERARQGAANAVADRFGFPRPYRDLDDPRSLGA